MGCEQETLDAKRQTEEEALDTLGKDGVTAIVDKDVNKSG